MSKSKSILSASLMAVGVALSSSLLLSSPPSAQQAKTAAAPATGLIDATTPERILSVARGFGNAELEKDRQGDPRIRGRMEGKTYFVNFYGCKESKACRTIQFRAWFELKKKPTIEAANEYNMKYRFLKVYVDKDQDLAVEFDVNLDGGVSTRNLDDTFDWWKVTMKSVMRDFPE